MVEQAIPRNPNIICISISKTKWDIVQRNNKKNKIIIPLGHFRIYIIYIYDKCDLLFAI